MDFSKLDQNEKLATYGAIAVIVGGLVGFGAAGLGFLAVLAAAAMLIVVFLPQFSPGTNLPGSRGSLMVLLGGIAAVVLVLGLLSVLSALGFMLEFAAVATIFYLVAVAGGVLMAWAGWQEFQSEGGKFQLGTSTSATPRTDRTDASAGAGAAAGSATATGGTATTGTATGGTTTGGTATTGTASGGTATGGNADTVAGGTAAAPPPATTPAPGSADTDAERRTEI